MGIYDRQKSLDLQIPTKIAVIGVGGIGSWVGLNLALVGVKNLSLIDHDTIEETNLNRTPYRLVDIGKLKVEALTEIILERRKDIDITPIPLKIEQVLEKMPTFLNDVDIVIDCRDKFSPIEIQKTYIKLGYDGRGLTIHINPKRKTLVWGEGGDGYRITPSYLAPPQLLANILTELITNKNLHYIWEKQDFIVNTNMEEIVKKILVQVLF